jgi:hypothetical protein
MDLLRKFGIAVVALLAVGATVASASDSGTSSGEATGSSQDSDSGSKDTGESDEVDDVKISNCGIESVLNLPEATIKVTNNSEKASDYMIEITFQSKGRQGTVRNWRRFHLEPEARAIEDREGDRIRRGECIRDDLRGVQRRPN